MGSGELVRAQEGQSSPAPTSVVPASAYLGCESVSELLRRFPCGAPRTRLGSLQKCGGAASRSSSSRAGRSEQQRYGGAWRSLPSLGRCCTSIGVTVLAATACVMRNEQAAERSSS
jgi:hypothetical protein